MRFRDALSRARAPLVAVLMLTTTGFAGNRPTETTGAPERSCDWRTARVVVDDVVRPRDFVTRSRVDDRIRPAGLLSALDADTIPSPGIAIGITSYDMQHNYAQGHQVASNPGSETVHFLWTMWDVIPDNSQNSDRWVNYNSWDKPTASLNQGLNGTGVSLGDFARAGMVRIDVDSDNLCHATFHQRIEEYLPYSIWTLYFPIEGSTLHLDSELPRNPLWPDESGHLWPDIAVSQNHGLKDAGTDIRHVISSGLIDIGEYPFSSDHIWYWRYDQGAAIPTWEGPALIDSSSAVSYTIDAADASGKVAVAFTSNYATDNLNGLNNVAYRESQTAGAGWLDGTEVGETFKNLITAYSTEGGPDAWVETSVAYDHRGVLHIVFLEQRAPGSEEMAVMHYSSERGTVRPAATAHYANPNHWLKALNISQISLGIGDGATLCDGGATTNEDYLYVLYTKLGGETPLEQADTSAQGFANGELYLTASPNGGDNWTPPANLTNTKTPDCDSDNPEATCASEAWATIARDVSDIEILYVRDYESGAYDESGWTMNDVMYLSIPGGTTDAAYLCPYFPCDCSCHGDPQCDGVTDILDVVRAIDVAFRSAPPVFDYACPYERTDVDCSGATDILDVVHFVNVALRGGDPETEFCDGCP
ncbi:MAG TPA: hypothetical protein VM118_04640 [Acidobacteriota bacterium]|nr:hypothetical protein [Acidobacteriota bacterium]